MGLDPDSDPSFSAAQSNSLNVIQPPPSQHFQPSDEASLTTPQAPTPSAPQASIPSTSEPPMSAGTKAHFQCIGKAKCHKNPLPAPYSKSKKYKPSTSSSNEKIIQPHHDQCWCSRTV
ncbi:alphaK I8 [Puccinia sorghi]|uniref:AlphaK I8 n=1 Tax=Puccinia sorghi TaxID=27349 RepID=A0A0L6VNN9_9BASI|nr:alphaK I8 [Puccinia sorghi]